MPYPSAFGSWVGQLLPVLPVVVGVFGWACPGFFVPRRVRGGGIDERVPPFAAFGKVNVYHNENVRHSVRILVGMVAIRVRTSLPVIKITVIIGGVLSLGITLYLLRITRMFTIMIIMIVTMVHDCVRTRIGAHTSAPRFDRMTPPKLGGDATCAAPTSTVISTYCDCVAHCPA